MMNVSRKSWHYRLHTLAFTCWNLDTYGPIAYLEGRRYEHQPKSLCGYFWSTLTLLLLCIPMAIFVALLLAAAAMILGLEKLHDAYRGVRPKPLKPAKPPKEHPRVNVFKEYTKARKAKVCPRIELVD